MCRELQLPTLRQGSCSPATTHRKAPEPRRRAIHVSPARRLRSRRTIRRKGGGCPLPTTPARRALETAPARR